MNIRRRAASCIVIAPLALAGCKPGLSDCEEAIQATLKAPSTYKRIKATGGPRMYSIDYDAENLMGVPLRGEGICLIDGETKVARWIEVPRRY